MNSLTLQVAFRQRFEGTARIARAITRRQLPRAADVKEAFLEMDGWHSRISLLRDPNHPAGSVVRYALADGAEESRRRQSSQLSSTTDAPLGLPGSPLLAAQTVPPKKWTRRSHTVEAAQLRAWLNQLLALAAVRRRVVADTGHHLLAVADAYAAPSPLFGALVIELVGECTGVASQARCYGCQRGFRPTNQNQRYCPACRKTGVPQKLAQQTDATNCGRRGARRVADRCHADHKPITDAPVQAVTGWYFRR